MILRPLQTQFISDLRAAFASGHRRVLGAAATGFGKGECAGYMAAAAEAKGKTALGVTHRAELKDQLQAAFLRWGAKAHVINVQTLVRRLDSIPEPGFLFVDEFHHAASPSYQKVLDRWQTVKVCGMTATPARLDGRGLGSAADVLIQGPDAGTLIQAGWLSRPVYYAPTLPPLTDVPLSRGDYDNVALSTAVDRHELTGSAVTHYRTLCPDARSVAFCVNRAHAGHVAQEFRDAGVNAVEFHGGLPVTIRAERMAGFRAGAIRILVSVDLIGEGLDVAACGAVILLRPTMSLGLHLQQIGRGLRLDPENPSKVCYVLDHAGNCLRHGLGEWPRTWTLDAKARRGREMQEPLMVILRCPRCYLVSGTRTDCPCGYQFTAEERAPKQAKGTLSEVQTKVCPRCGDPTIADARCQTCAKKERIEEGMCRTLADWQALGRNRGWKPDAAWMRFKARGGFAGTGKRERMLL